MTTQFPCPERERLQALLNGVHDDPELTAHLDRCTVCQRELERLAHGDTPLPFPRPAPRPVVQETALHRVMDELKDNPADLGDDDFSLDFLTPSDRPESLGRFGPYEVEQVIGRGGMGIVLKALDPDLNRIVAIKVIAPSFAAHGAMRRRFTREARAAAAVCHDHVVTIHHVETSGPLPYLVMQYVPGPSLEERLDRNGPLELKEILRIGMQTAAGLAAAHAHGLIHRDVKPANILLEDDMERVKLTDFGLARAMDDVRITQSAVLAGTPQYMAPEQARGEPLDYRADLFSLGSVLYAMCTGRPPFRAGAPLAVMKRVCEEQPRSIREQNPNIPEWLEAIIMKLLEKDPTARFQSAAEVSDLLGRCLAHVQQPKSVRLPVIPYRQPAPPRRSSWRRPLAMAATFLALLICGLGATVITVRTNRGTLVIEVDDPNVKVTVENDNIIVAEPDGTEIRLRAGDYKVKATKDGKVVDNKPITIKRGEKTIVTIRAEQPAAVGQALDGGRVREPEEKRQTGLPRERATSAVRWELYVKGTQAAFSADGKTIATSTADGTVYLQDASTGYLLTKIQAHRGRIRALKLLPDRKLLITVGDDGEIKVWDVPTGKTVSAHDLPIKPTKTALSPDGKVLAGAAEGQAVRLWDISSGKELVTLQGDSAVQALAFSPDGKVLATGTPPGTVRLWDAHTGKAFLRMQAPRTDNSDPGALPGGSVVALPWITQNDQSIAFSPDGKLLACGTGEAVICLWDVNSGKEVRTLTTSDGQVGIVVFSPDGKQLLSAGEDKAVRVWDVTTGKEVRQLKTADGSIIGVTVSPDGKRILTISGDGSIKLWDAATGKQAAPGQQSSKDADRKLLEELEQNRQQAHSAYVDAFRNSALERGQALQRQQYAHTIAEAQRLWEASGKPGEAAKALDQCPAGQRGWEWRYLKRLAAGEKPKLEATMDTALNGVAFSPDGRTLALAGADGTARLVYASSPGKEARVLTHDDTVQALAFSPDGKLLVTASTDSTTRLWEVETGKPAGSVGDSGVAHAVAFSPNGKRLASAYTDGRIRTWLVSTAGGGSLWKAHEGDAFGVCFSPDGKRLASVGADHKVRVWDAVTDKSLLSIVGSSEPILAVAFSPDGKRVATGGLDKAAHVWDPATGKEVLALEGHHDSITALAFSPDSTRLATASADKTVKLWDAANGNELLTLEGHTAKVTGVAFSPDGTKLATCGADKRIIIYDGTPKGR